MYPLQTTTPFMPPTPLLPASFGSIRTQYATNTISFLPVCPLLDNNPLQGIDQCSVCCLWLVVAVKKERVVTRSPAVLVRDSPDGDSDALWDLEAGVHDSEVIVGGGTRNVELGDGNLLDVGRSESPQGSGNTRGRVPSAGGCQVALGANAVDWDTLSEPLVDLFDHTPGDFGVVGNVEVVVVDVQLRGRIGGTRCAEGDANKVLAENAAEDAVAERAVFSKDLVDDIPLDDLALVACDRGGDMVLDNLGQGVAVVDVLHPLRQLGVPKEGMATDELAIGLGKVDNGVGVGECELIAARYNSHVN